MSPPPLPTGTLTFLFTGIEGSTARWETQREALAKEDWATLGQEGGHRGPPLRSHIDTDGLDPSGTKIGFAGSSNLAEIRMHAPTDNWRDRRHCSRRGGTVWPTSGA